MKLIVLLLCLVVTSATADDATVTVPLSSLRELVAENLALKKEVNKLDDENEELFKKWRQRIGQVGECT